MTLLALLQQRVPPPVPLWDRLRGQPLALRELQGRHVAQLRLQVPVLPEPLEPR